MLIIRLYYSAFKWRGKSFKIIQINYIAPNVVLTLAGYFVPVFQLLLHSPILNSATLKSTPRNRLKHSNCRALLFLTLFLDTACIFQSTLIPLQHNPSYPHTYIVLYWPQGLVRSYHNLSRDVCTSVPLSAVGAAQAEGHSLPVLRYPLWGWRS